MRLLLVAIVLLAGPALAPVSAAPPRFLYFVTCDARVDKLDTSTGRTVATYDLVTRTGDRSLVPVVRGVPDACLSASVVFDDRTSVFYTVVPTTDAPGPDGMKEYRILGFAVPAMRLTRVIPVSGRRDATPRIRLGTRGGVRLLPDSVSPVPIAIDLSPLGPDRRPLPNQVLEQSGDRVLVRLFTSDPRELVLAVALRDRGTLVRLAGSPRTVAPRAHLSPGGTHVLVEEVTADSLAPSPTGRLVLFDATSGKLRSAVTDTTICALGFLALSPGGKAVYHAGERYHVVDLGARFGTSPVRRPASAGRQDCFFARR